MPQPGKLNYASGSHGSATQLAALAGVQAPAAVCKLNHAVTQAVQSAEMRHRMGSLGAEPRANPPEEFAGFIARRLRKWGGIVQRSGAVVD